MDYPIHIDAISTDLSILYFEGLPVQISKNMMYFCPWRLFLSMKTVADPDEMLLYAAFHLDLQCWLKDLLTCIQNEKGYGSTNIEREKVTNGCHNISNVILTKCNVDV